MQSKWTLVKISKATRQRLESVRDSLQLAEDMGARSLDRDNRDRVSLDQVIAILVDARERHAERRRRASARRRHGETIDPETRYTLAELADSD